MVDQSTTLGNIEMYSENAYNYSKKISETLDQIQIANVIEKIVTNLVAEKLEIKTKKILEDFSYSVDQKILEFEEKFDKLSEKISTDILKKIAEKSMKNGN